MRKLVDLEEAERRIKEAHGNDITIVDYSGVHKCASFYCNICGHDWTTIPIYVFNGNGCQKCSLKKVSENNIVKIDDAKEKLFKKHGDKYCLLEYKTMSKSALFLCNNCTNEWNARAGSVINGGSGCPVCRNKTKINEVEKMLIDRHNGKIVIKEYCGNMNDPSTFECVICGWSWSVPCKNVTTVGTGCPNCFNIRRGSSLVVPFDAALERLFEMHGDNITMLEYGGGLVNIAKFLCNICGTSWSVKASDVISQGHSCPTCKQSKGETKIRKYLKKINVEFKPEFYFSDCVHKRMLPFDFYVPRYNLCIEYQGIQHHEPIAFFGGENSLADVQKRDKIKLDYCNTNNIPFLRINFWDFDNIEEILEKHIKEIYNEKHAY